MTNVREKLRLMWDSSERTPGTADTCEYGSCRKPGAGEMRYHQLVARDGIPWTACAEHLKEKWHPSDIRARPGKYLVRW
jgi:hypothetical protein